MTAISRIECPVCHVATVTLTGSGQTLMGFSIFSDEAGDFHTHDGNKITESYKCSNGHSFDRSTGHACDSCDWRSDYKINEHLIYFGEIL